MRLLAYFLLFSISSFGQKSQAGKSEYFFPAEWEPHRGIIISFDNELKADSASVNMVKALSSSMKVYCIILGDSLIPYYKNWFQKENAITDSIQFILFGVSDPYCIRDPIFFLINNQHELKIMDFRWTYWGTSPQSDHSDTIRKAFINNFCGNFQYPVVQSDMVAEGGAIEVNGKGVLLQVESVNLQRNAKLTKDMQEMELKKNLGVSKIIWLKQGPADDPAGDTIITGHYLGMGGVRGHVDEFCRFANAKTIFLTYPETEDTLNNPVSKITLERMKINYKILEGSTDQNGKHFKIVKFPDPDLDPIRWIIDTLSSKNNVSSFSKYLVNTFRFKNHDTCYFVPASSYLNYLVTNNKVLIPKYWREGKPLSTKLKDERARIIFAKYFPDREIIQINPTGMNYRGGGMHCWSQQIPK
jgi:agmatine deiminase